MIFVTAYLGGTHGTAKSARDFLRALLACLPDVKVISPTREEFPSELCECSLSVPTWLEFPQNIRLPRRIWKIRPSTLRAWQQDRQRKRLFQSISQYETVIVNGWASYSFWLSVESRFKGRKIIIIRESPRHFSGGDRQITLQQLIDGFLLFDDLIFVSENVRQEWLKFPALQHKRSFYLPNCCEEEEVEKELAKRNDNSRQALGLSTNEFIVICPGSIEYRKGQDLLIQILPELILEIPNLRILLVGELTTQWGQDLLNKSILGKYKKWVTYLSSRSTILDIMNASDVLAFPSRAEAMPRTILEAMALKLPVVASAVDGIPELVIDGETGILFNADDSQGLLKGILQLARNPTLAKKLAARGHIRYWENFSRKKQFQRMQQLLTEINH
ncbi:MAG: hypothetical protein RLZZ507_3307 [Cyanobacteriota bacterium]|jgi:glycosyltransferase involved in cell wall biosynthesis